MIRKANISIPTPCHENWDSMTVADKGRFCASCQKHVYDFTKSSDREILEKINSTGNLCGRFSSTQLDRELSAPKEKNSLWIAAATGVLAFLGAGNGKAYAQGAPVVQTDQRTSEVTDKTKAIPLHERISGIVSDSTGVLPGVTVLVKGTENGVQTDVDGHYSIMAKENDILVFSYVGLNTLEMTVTDNLEYNVLMNSFGIQLQGFMITSPKRTYAGRIFHRIGNWFRKPGNKRF